MKARFIGMTADKWLTKEQLKQRLGHEQIAFKDVDFIFQNYSLSGHKFRNKNDDYCQGCVIDAIFAVKYFKGRFSKRQ